MSSSTVGWGGAPHNGSDPRHMGVFAAEIQRKLQRAGSVARPGSGVRCRLAQNAHL
jgi:hypothetical protein